MTAIDLESLVLKAGKHKSRGDDMCVMEVVSYFAGEPHSDHPQCTCPALTLYAMTLNDRMDDVNRQKLKPFIPRLVGTRDGNELRRAKILAWAAITEILPDMLRMWKPDGHAERLEKLTVYDWKTAREACEEVRKGVMDAYDAADYAASASASAYVASAAYASAYVASAAYAAWSAAFAASARNEIYDLALAALDRAIRLEDYTDAQAGREGEG